MIDFGTLAGLLEHQHQLDAWCPRCDRWTELDRATLVAAGHGSRRLPLRMRRRAYGDLGRARRPNPQSGW